MYLFPKSDFFDFLTSDGDNQIDTLIDIAPLQGHSSSYALFRFTATRPSCDFIYTLDGNAPVTVHSDDSIYKEGTSTALHTIAEIPDGDHTISVVSKCSNGTLTLVDSTPAVHSWTITTTPISWESRDITVTVTEDGRHVVRAWATDQASLEDVSGTEYEWFLDRTKPILTLSLVQEYQDIQGIHDKPDNHEQETTTSRSSSTKLSGTVILTATDGDSSAIILITRHDSINVTLATNEAIVNVALSTTTPSSSTTTTALPDIKSGEFTTNLTLWAEETIYVITGHATDIAGNVASSKNEIRVTLDTSPPAASFATDIRGAPSSIERTLTVTFAPPTCDDPPAFKDACTFLYAVTFVDTAVAGCYKAVTEWRPLTDVPVDEGTGLHLVDVTDPGTYEVRVRAIDHVGNVEKVPPPDAVCSSSSSCAQVSVTLEKPPGQPVVRRIGKRILAVTFAGVKHQREAEGKKITGGQRYDVQWSSRVEFNALDTRTITIGPTDNDTIILHVNTTEKLTKEVVFVRVSIHRANLWSPLSLDWQTTSKCGPFQYLDDRFPKIHDAEGNATHPTPSRLDPNMRRWNCEPCPIGASCNGNGGDVTWSDVRALWGWWRISSGVTAKDDVIGSDGILVDDGNVRSNFTKCIYPPACLGARNPALEGRYFNVTTDGDGAPLRIDLAMVKGRNESCWVQNGHRDICRRTQSAPSSAEGIVATVGDVVRCRLCHTCLPGHEHGTQGQCTKCPEGDNNKWLLAGGAVFIFAAASVLVWMQIDNQGKGGLSDAVKKVLLNYLQMAALAQGFPLQWPEAVESMFAVQSTVSTAGQYMLRPDCELSNLEAADAFYHKMIMFSTLPPVCVLVSVVFWFFYAKCRCAVCACTVKCCCGKKMLVDCRCCRKGPAPWRRRESTTYSPKDKMVCCIVVLLYMLYPTMITQVFSMLACKQVGESRYLKSDLQEMCFEGRHFWWVLLLCVPQLLLYVFAIPLIGVYFLRRNKDSLWKNRVVMFRYGLLFNGYSEKYYFWEGTMSIRKASIVALGIFGSLTGVESQTHAGLLILVAFLVFHLAASPYDRRMDPRGILHALDTSSLVIIWGTLWSGLLFYRGDMDLLGKEILSVTIVLVNLLFTATGIYLLVRELARESGLVDRMSSISVLARKMSGKSPPAELAKAATTVLGTYTTGSKRKYKRKPASNEDSAWERRARGNLMRETNAQREVEMAVLIKKNPMLKNRERAQSSASIKVFDEGNVFSNPLVSGLEGRGGGIAVATDETLNTTNGMTIAAAALPSIDGCEDSSSSKVVDSDVNICADEKGRRYKWNPATRVSVWLDKAEEVLIVDRMLRYSGWTNT
eukprot:g1220.t1